VNRRELIVCGLPLPCTLQAFGSDATPREDWSGFFTDAKAEGTVVVVDERRGHEATWVHDDARARRRVTPASTFKIVHSLFALDAGVLRDEFERIRWDGVKRANEAWNADQDLRSAMRNSTVWVYERFARQIGKPRESAYMRRIGYGNALASGPDPFWVEGDLAISAYEQIRLLRSLYRNELPFRIAHQRLVKDVMINEAHAESILRAKTGWSGRVGWWVGWIEWPSGSVFFALNIDTPNRWDDLPKRQSITRGILQSLGALPQR
jgi:beta-lactamase class D